jgi:hypothetical protein
MAPRPKSGSHRFRGEGVVVAYRVYFLDGMGRFTRTEAVEATSDEDAVGLARPLMGDSLKCEIWDRQRFVAKVTADDRSN